MTPIEPSSIDLPAPAAPPVEPADVRRKYVRVVERTANGLVAFEFSIGWPELAAELVLPVALFDEFCARHQVERLPDAPRGAVHGIPIADAD